jgi:hypothetical protein
MLIGLGYAARSGKDEVANLLVRDYGFKKIAYADAVKDAVRVIFGLTQRQLYGDEKELVDEYCQDTHRNILQKVGTECMRRGYRDDIWIKALFRQLSLDEDGEPDWVVTDVRFSNEADAVKERGGWLVKVSRPERLRDQIATKLHASETSMIGYEGWDYEIVNDDSLETLSEKVDDMITHFTKCGPIIS